MRQAFRCVPVQGVAQSKHGDVVGGILVIVDRRVHDDETRKDKRCHARNASIRCAVA